MLVPCAGLASGNAKNLVMVTFTTGGNPVKYGNYRVRAIDRALQMLTLFKPDHSEIHLQEFADALGVHKSTAHRIAVTLEYSGFLSRNTDGSAYTLGLKPLELGAIVLSGHHLRRQARPVLEWLQSTTGETVHLGVLDSGEVIYIDKIEGESGLKLFSDLGKQAPVHCTGLGKALLCDHSDTSIRKVLEEKGMRRYTKYTVVSVDHFLALIHDVRRNGWATDHEEHERLVHCVAVPIRNHTGKIVAAISITTITANLGACTVQRTIDLTIEAGQRISAAMV